MVYSKWINYIKGLDKQSLQKYLVTQRNLPDSDERTFNIGYSLLRLDCLEEAASIFNSLAEGDLNKVKILLTGYYKDDCDGNWHEYDDTCEQNCESCGTGLCCLAICIFGNCGRWC